MTDLPDVSSDKRPEKTKYIEAKPSSDVVKTVRERAGKLVDGTVNVQKDFHKALKKEGLVPALKLLADNYEINPKFAKREAEKMLRKLEFKLDNVERELRKIMHTNSVNIFMATLQADYRAMSERQKTKISFRQYLTNYLDKNRPEKGYSDEDEAFNVKLFEGIGGEKKPVFGGSMTTPRDRYEELHDEGIKQHDEVANELEEVRTGMKLIRELLGRH